MAVIFTQDVCACCVTSVGVWEGGGGSVLEHVCISLHKNRTFLVFLIFAVSWTYKYRRMELSSTYDLLQNYMKSIVLLLRLERLKIGRELPAVCEYTRLQVWMLK